MAETYELPATPAANPTLEESAKAMGIDPTKVDDTATSQTATPDFTPAAVKERPENIPEKFWDAEKGELNTEALLKSYTELEKTKNPKQDEKTPEPKAEEKPKEETEAEKAAKEATDKAGLNLDDLSAKFWENDGLETTDYEALDKAGYPKHIVDQFIEGQRLIVERDQAKAYEAAGGAENYTAMIGWASDGLSPKEIEAYNDNINSGDINKVVLAVSGLRSKFEAANGREPNFVQGGANRGSGEAYESVEQMKADMRDPRYQKDSAFRAKVEAKVARSTAF